MIDRITCPPIVGLVGKKRSGKDSVATVLVDEFGFTRVAFADPLKEAALALDPLVGPAPIFGDFICRHRHLSEIIAVEGWESAKDRVPGVRETLQRLGSAIRDQSREFWVDKALETIRDLHDAGRPVVVTDVRMPNEADMIADRFDGLLVRVTRPGVTVADSHISETAMDDYTCHQEVINDGSLEDLADHVRAEVARLTLTL